jgi:CDP-diacylglycerol--glycerol-3-phosphate 3-phosphatidyltransferase
VSGSVVTPETRQRVKRLGEPIALALGRLGLTPNTLTVIGFAGTCVAALAASFQLWALAGVLVLAFGIFDMFDGTLARATGRASKFGAFLDSTLDRIGECLVLGGVAVGCASVAEIPFVAGVALAVLAATFASVVTYTRARAESLGVHGEVGIAPRPERLVLLAAGLILAGLFGGIRFSWDGFGNYHAVGGGEYPLAIALGLIALLSAITVVQRILHVKRQIDEVTSKEGMGL